MGTLYDLLGALPSDDAEELRKAFRKAAKATHPDINPDNPDAALRFRELVRAYDILTDNEQRATYDQLLAIALQPPATKAIQTYETVRKVASNTMAATVISAVLVGGYTVFVPRSACTAVNMSREDALKFILTAGLKSTSPGIEPPGEGGLRTDLPAR
jgi:curved DNA-binding protein CbpA